MKVLVTGGGGFLGFQIVKILVERGNEVVVLGRNKYLHVESIGAKSVVANICELQSILPHFEGVDEVFHVAALAGIWGKWQTYYDINFVGTQNVIQACKTHNVKRLIHTSSPSVVFDGKSHRNIDESTPYPERFLSHYSETKMLAEKLVLQTNSDELQTVALRPHLIWGPGDPHIFPRIVEKARKGQLAIVGSGQNEVDIIYVENAAIAHIQAADALRESGVTAGKAYFLGQNKPVKLWDFIAQILEREGIPPVRRRVSSTLTFFIGYIFELVHRAFKIDRDPRMTRFLSCQLSQDHYYDHQSAKKDFNYDAKISVEEGLNRIYTKTKGFSR